MQNIKAPALKTRLVRVFVLAAEGRSPLKAVWTLVTEALDESELFRPVRWSFLHGRALHLAVSSLR